MHAPQISCCFSGYRPGKLPWGNDENDPRCRALKVRLRDVMEAAYDEGYRHFICGMAQGCDLYFCELALQLRGERPDMTIEALFPRPQKGGRHPLPHAGGQLERGGAPPLARLDWRLRRADASAGELQPALYAAAQPLHGRPRGSADRGLRWAERRHTRNGAVRDEPRAADCGYSAGDGLTGDK